MPRYSKEFKSQMVARLIGPPTMTATGLAKEVGISHSSLSDWLREARSLGGMTRSKDSPSGVDSSDVVPTTTPVGQRDPRSPQDQLRILALASTLSGDALGAMLRREGVHAAELNAWRETVLLSLRGGPPAPAASSADRKRIQQLERELARKEKALAEAAALLMLQKKVRAYLGDEDERTDGRSER
jgi:transposase-like protein